MTTISHPKTKDNPLTSCCNSVIATNAARNFKTLAPVLRKAKVLTILESKRGGSVLEVGAGCLRNALYLQREGFKVSVLEVEGIEQRFPKEYKTFKKNHGRVYYKFPRSIAFDMIVCTFVVETICNIEQRKNLVRLSRHQLKRDGVFIISARGPADLVTATAYGVKCSDGFITPNKSFARSFTREQLHELLTVSGFRYIKFLHKQDTNLPELLHALASKAKL